ncbi:MAG: hypothetical protein HYY96_16615 [Candidatus Tectomicrobia bacterium]|nr:hypothetical protein [Candidatus Tectomicrobia bacterium]
MDGWLSASSRDAVSLLALLVTVVGFCWAIYQAWRAKQEATEAAKAARGAQAEIQKNLGIADFINTKRLIDAVKLHHLNKDWVRAHERYGDIRNGLVNLRSLYPSMSTQQRTDIQSAITAIAKIDQEVSEAISKNQEPHDPLRFNGILFTVQTILDEVIGELQLRIGT